MADRRRAWRNLVKIYSLWNRRSICHVSRTAPRSVRHEDLPMTTILVHSTSQSWCINFLTGFPAVDDAPGVASEVLVLPAREVTLDAWTEFVQNLVNSLSLVSLTAIVITVAGPVVVEHEVKVVLSAAIGIRKVDLRPC